MLSYIRLQNYRGFSDHELPLKHHTVIVGANNAGKSTIVEALRLVSIITNRHANLNYRTPPPEAGIARRMKVVAPSVSKFDFDFTNVSHKFGDPPSLVEARFVHGETVHVVIGHDQKVYGYVTDNQGTPVAQRSVATKIRLPKIHVLPQIGPLEREERLLTPEHVTASGATPLASLHFRNQLSLMSTEFKKFIDLAEATWPGLRIRELVNRSRTQNSPLALLVQDEEYVAEVSWMGHGLQMWLQTMWFLARCEKDSVVILDEPDVYLHPDLQRKLVRIIKPKFVQSIIATHSIEIMSNVDPANVLIIERRRNKSRFAGNEPGLQRVIDQVGSNHNLSLARLYSSKRCLIVEGNDLSILASLFDILHPDAPMSLDYIPHFPIGGWGGWKQVPGIAMLLNSLTSTKCLVYCVLDSDYHTPDQKTQRIVDAQTSGVQLHIWNRKEVENYLLIPSAILRVIASRVETGTVTPTIANITRQLRVIAGQVKADVTDAYGSEFLADDRAKGFPAARKKAEQIVQASWTDTEERVSILPGKEVFSRLSSWAEKNYKVSFGPMAVVRVLKADEVDVELRRVIEAIHAGRPLPGT